MVSLIIFKLENAYKNLVQRKRIVNLNGGPSVSALRGKSVSYFNSM